MSRIRTLKSEGFTVIETLIVLAIAGLILLIVLLAIPALTRSSRNNQRKQDVQAILEYISHYELNNSGDIPTSVPATVKLTYYSAGNVSITVFTNAASSNSNTNSTDLDHVNIYNHQLCSGSNGTNAAAGFNDVAALYSIEAANGTAPQCQQL